MTGENTQARKGVINIYLSFCFSFLIAILLTNIYTYSCIYVFLLFFVIWLYILIWYKNLYPLVISWVLWIIFWYLLSIHNISNINSNILKLDLATSNFSAISDIEWRISWIEWTNEEKQYIFELHKINDIKMDDIKIIIKANIMNLSKWDIIKAKLKINDIVNNSDFDYRSYLQMRWIYWQARLSEFTKIWKQINVFDNSIEKIRSIFLNIIKKMG